MLLCLPVVALMVATAPPAHVQHRYRWHGAAASATRNRNDAAEALLRRRVGRLLRLALLEQRERKLRAFLVRANTETPFFRDDEVHALAIGVRIGPTIVTYDFLGNLIIRAQVRNVQPRAMFAVFEAHIRSGAGRIATAAAAIALQSGESRNIELWCPTAAAPAALMWSATAL